MLHLVCQALATFISIGLPAPEEPGGTAQESDRAPSEGTWAAMQGRKVRLVVGESGETFEGELVGSDDATATLIAEDGAVMSVDKASVAEMSVLREASAPVAPSSADVSAPATAAVDPSESVGELALRDYERPIPPNTEEADAGRKDDEDERFDRQGFYAMASLGVRACIVGERCDDAGGDYAPDVGIKAGVLLGLGAGYRPIRWVSFGASFGFAAHGLDTSGNDAVESGRGRSFNVLADVVAHPVARSRVDPFLGLGLGFTQDAVRAEHESFGEGKLRLRRGLFRVGAGLPIYLGEHVALGPRFDADLPFAGKLCLEGGGETECSDADESSGLPRWIAASLLLRAQF